MDQHLEIKDSTQSNTARIFTFSLRQLLIAIGVVVLFIVILLMWKSVAIQTLKKEQSEREKGMQTQFARLYEEQSAAYLKSLAKPYVWTLRTEMLQGNMSAVSQYNNDMVKLRNFHSVIVADPKGVIVSSTDKKYEGKSLASMQMENYLQADSTVVTKVDDSLLVMASPVMSFNSKLGTLIIRYTLKLPSGIKK